MKPGTQGYPLFTNYAYDNLGVPKNPENPFYANLAYNPAGAAWIDTGLGGFLQTVDPTWEALQRGKMKVPTLRNVDKRPYPTFVRAYGHNGAFKTLRSIIHFYHMRGMGRTCACFGPPEVNANLATINMFPGFEISSIETFLKTLSDTR